MFVFRKTTNIWDKKELRLLATSFFFAQALPKNSVKSIEAIFQFSRLMQYFTLGVSISPCINPASFSSFRC